VLHVGSPSARQDFRNAWADFLTPNSEVHCHGDEASLCCPFELRPESLTVDVIAEGVVRHTPSDSAEVGESEYQLVLEGLCQVEERQTTVGAAP
jgi:hypothetical protein